MAYSKKKIIEKHYKSHNADQAGIEVLVLKDAENLPIYLIKKHAILSRLQFASHKNIIPFVNNFQSKEIGHLVYEYDYLAISPGCIVGAIQFSEADIATIYKGLLEVLKYIYLGLKTLYSLLNFSNILLTWQGEVKLSTGRYQRR